MEQVSDRLMFKIWPIFFFPIMVHPTSNLLARIGYITSSNAMMNWKPGFQGNTIISVLNLRTQSSSRTALFKIISCRESKWGFPDLTYLEYTSHAIDVLPQCWDSWLVIGDSLYLCVSERKVLGHQWQMGTAYLEAVFHSEIQFVPRNTILTESRFLDLIYVLLWSNTECVQRNRL